MYFVNRDMIEKRLNCIPEIAETVSALAAGWESTVLQGMAQERALHLAIEMVTDVGSALIDGFLMRDASSYEDIIDIIAGEEVIPSALAEPLRQLVSLRKPLVQEYYDWPRGQLHPLTPQLPLLLEDFAERVRNYLQRELG